MLARHLGWVVGYSPQLGWRVMMYNSSEMHSTSEECSDNNNVCRDLCTPGTRGTLSMLVSRIRHYSRTMLLFPSLGILLFPSLDIVRTDVCATHYATPHVRHTTVQYYSVQIMLARSVPEVCSLPETSSRDCGHRHTPSPRRVVTQVVALPVYGLLRFVPLL